jgi:hypothetical protein
MRANAWPLASFQAWVIPRSPVIARISIARRCYASISAADLKFGQPVHETHPHLLKVGEGKKVVVSFQGSELILPMTVTPGISALEYANRRDKLVERLPHGAIAILAAAPIKYRAGVVFYDFHQDSDFFYLTGNKPGFEEEPRKADLCQASMNLKRWRLLVRDLAKSKSQTRYSYRLREDWETRRAQIPPLRSAKRRQGPALGGGSIWDTGC